MAGIVEAALENNEIEMLRATQLRIAEVLDYETTLARDLASLSKRLMEISKEIAALEAAQVKEADDHVSEESAEFDIDEI